MRILRTAALTAALVLLAALALADVTPCKEPEEAAVGLIRTPGPRTAVDGREGGETVADAFPFATVPFTDTRNSSVATPR